VAEVCFWLCLLLLFYAWVGYPLLVALASLFAPPRPLPTGKPATASVIVAAFDEQAHIEKKLRSMLAQDHAAAFEIIVASDGSTDDTVALARAVAAGDARVRVLDLPRRGKADALNDAALVARYEVLVFSDADTYWVEDTLRQLLAPMADATVGSTVGNVSIPRLGRALSLGDRLYRRYEAFMRKAESRLGWMASADGGLFALRRELFQPVPPQVTDDFFLTTCAPMNGKRIVYVDEAVVLDRGVDEPERQFHRRRRITARGLQSLAARRELMNPLRFGFTAVALVSHKLIRRLAPLALAPLFVCNLLLWDEGAFYRLALCAQLAAYIVAVVGLFDRAGRLPKPFRFASFMLVSMTGMVAGLWRFSIGRRFERWNPKFNR
jgi:cellulose synthase/poly-beta-1,6-N-acetylglucosamine synthase-like glycosyltransferase